MNESEKEKVMQGHYECQTRVFKLNKNITIIAKHTQLNSYFILVRSILTSILKPQLIFFVF